MNRLLQSFAAAVVGALTLTSAATARDDRVPDLRVAYGDLDLSRPADAAVFHARVDAAVDGWCERNDGLFEGQRVSAATLCRRHARQLVGFSTPAADRDALRIAAAAARQPALVVASR
jgi:UrcA family protein